MVGVVGSCIGIACDAADAADDSPSTAVPTSASAPAPSAALTLIRSLLLCHSPRRTRLHGRCQPSVSAATDGAGQGRTARRGPHQVACTPTVAVSHSQVAEHYVTEFRPSSWTPAAFRCILWLMGGGRPPT